MHGERLPLPDFAAMTDEQRTVAEALIQGPRKGVYGPFVALLRSPQLLDRVARIGEYLRFGSVLEPRVRELAICAVARQMSNRFEWAMHAPLAIQAGVAPSVIDALRAGARPKELSVHEEIALDFVRELLATHGASDATYGSAVGVLGEQGVVELASLVGYFAMVSWVMNVARTPPMSGGDMLPALPQ